MSKEEVVEEKFSWGDVRSPDYLKKFITKVAFAYNTPNLLDSDTNENAFYSLSKYLYYKLNKDLPPDKDELYFKPGLIPFESSLPMNPIHKRNIEKGLTTLLENGFNIEFKYKDKPHLINLLIYRRQYWLASLVYNNALMPIDARRMGYFQRNKYKELGDEWKLDLFVESADLACLNTCMLIIKNSTPQELERLNETNNLREIILSSKYEKYSIEHFRPTTKWEFESLKIKALRLLLEKGVIEDLKVDEKHGYTLFYRLLLADTFGTIKKTSTEVKISVGESTAKIKSNSAIAVRPISDKKNKWKVQFGNKIADLGKKIAGDTQEAGLQISDDIELLASPIPPVSVDSSDQKAIIQLYPELHATGGVYGNASAPPAYNPDFGVGQPTLYPPLLQSHVAGTN